MINENKFYSLIEIDDTQKAAASVFLGNRGIKEHIAMAEFLSAFTNRKPSYEEVATAFRYDKRLRRLIYKYIGLFEEKMRSYLSNNYNTIGDIPNFSLNLIKNQKQLSISPLDTDCYSFTNELFFKNLVNIFNSLPIDEVSSYFGIKRPLKKNLDAIVELRNAISHNRLLLNYKRFKDVTLPNGTISFTLSANVINLHHHLPTEIGESLKRDLVDIAKDKGNTLDSQVGWKIMSFYIVGTY